MDKKEIRDLGLAWLILSLAFANLLGGLSLNSILVSGLTAGMGFLLHELGHKLVAENYGLKASFIADYRMLIIAFFGSFAGIIFAAPGAVYTTGSRNSRIQMLISAAGPSINIALASIFMLIPGLVGDYGSQINSWLALFNLIPFGGLDGEKILQGSKPVYGALVGLSLVLLIL
jgi:Zn-dependent protease